MKRLFSCLCTTTFAVFFAHAAYAGGPDEGIISHVVVAWLKPEYRNEQGISAMIEAQEALRAIPGLKSLTVGRMIPSDRPIVDSTYDFASVFQFDSVETMQRYVSDPIHVNFVENYVKRMVDKTVVYDFGFLAGDADK